MNPFTESFLTLVCTFVYIPNLEIWKTPRMVWEYLQLYVLTVIFLFHIFLASPIPKPEFWYNSNKILRRKVYVDTLYSCKAGGSKPLVLKAWNKSSDRLPFVGLLSYCSFRTFLTFFWCSCSYATADYQSSVIIRGDCTASLFVILSAQSSCLFLMVISYAMKFTACTNFVCWQFGELLVLLFEKKKIVAISLQLNDLKTLPCSSPGRYLHVIGMKANDWDKYW